RAARRTGGGWPAERALRAFLRAHECLFARRPGDGAARPDRHVVDPAVLGIGREDDALSLRVGRHDLAVVAAGDDAALIGGRGEDGPAVDRDAARLARARHEKERLFAEHEHRRLPEKMRGHHRRAGIDRPRALHDGRDVGAAIGHRSISLVSRASTASALARAERDPGPSATIAKGNMNSRNDPWRGSWVPALRSRSALAWPGNENRYHAAQPAKPSLI